MKQSTKYVRKWQNKTKDYNDSEKINSKIEKWPIIIIYQMPTIWHYSKHFAYIHSFTYNKISWN